jgi:two-component system response regulator AlgR
VATSAPAHRSHIGARGRDGLKLIPIEEVFCFQADQKYTTVKHLLGEDLIEDSLKTLEEEFGVNFLRIHRNALVNTKYLERIARDASGQHFVYLRGLPEALEVSRRIAGDLKDRFRI